MHALVLLCVNPHMKFQLPSFTTSTDMISAKLKMGHVTLNMPLVGGLSSLGKHWMYSTCTQNLTTLASSVPGI